MAIGLLQEHDEDDVGILLPGHMFPLPGVGKKRKGGPSRSASVSRAESPWMNPLDIGPLNHIVCEAIEILDDPFPSDLEDNLTESTVWSPPSRPDSPAVLDFDLFAAFPPQPTVSGPEAKRPKLEADAELSRTPSSASGTKTPEDAASKSSAQTPLTSPDTRRGENVRKNPQMQQTARDGQKHWHDKVQEMRTHYDLAHTGMVHPQFQEQRLMCSVRNLKCQKESLLMFLQFSAQQGLISPLAFVHPGDEAAGFLGWTGFYIIRGCGARFRAGVEGLFPDTPKVNTLYHLFRRSGLVPEDWRRAWDGEAPFTWNPKSSA